MVTSFIGSHCDILKLRSCSRGYLVIYKFKPHDRLLSILEIYHKRCAGHVILDIDHKIGRTSIALDKISVGGTIHLSTLTCHRGDFTGLIVIIKLVKYELFYLMIGGCGHGGGLRLQFELLAVPSVIAGVDCVESVAP